MKGRRRWIRRIAIGVLVIEAVWVAANALSAFGAANLWFTELLWRSPDRRGQLAAAVPGTTVRTAAVRGHHVRAGSRDATVVVVHGYNGSRDSPPVIGVTRWLRDAGYGVLAIDLGYRDGRHRYTGGTREADDVRAAIDWLESQGQQVTGVWGFSAGGHASLIAAAEDTRIAWVIADGAFHDGAAQFRRTAAATWKVIPASSLVLVVPMFELFSGERPIDLLARPWPGTPALIVHGGDDRVVPTGDAEAIRDHTGGDLLVLPDVAHTQGHVTSPDVYRARAMAFIEHATVRSLSE